MSGEVTDQVADDSLRQALRSALLKVRSVLPQEKKDYLHQLKDKVGVWFRQPGGDHRRESLMPIQDAIARRRCLRICYICYNTANRGAITDRVVEPLGLVFYTRQWHLIAWCRLRGEVRDFRLDRVSRWEVLDEPCQERGGFSVKEFLRESIECHELTPATVRVDRDLLERFRNEIPCTPLSEETLPDGSVRMELLSFSLPWLTESLLRFGTRVEALEPLELRESLREAALAVAARYSEEFAGV
ncbi:MAG: WYL domain-containing protein [Verrucomicrobiaceae bacterium]|nr:MAG: WYL domain-containing protein [Verrucomicrobiaceae bacterium]